MCCVNPDVAESIIVGAAKRKPWAYLEEYRGKAFHGKWPTLPELYRLTASRFGERPSFTIYEPGRISLSYKEALAQIEAVSRYLCAQGICKGDKVAVSGKNAPEWAVAYLAVLFTGATVVPIDYQLKMEEVERILQKSKSKILFIDEEKFDHFTAKAAEFSLTKVLSLHKDKGEYIYTLDGPPAQVEASAYTDVAAILFTSGTTGVPKGVMLTHENLVSDSYLAMGNLVIYPSDVFYLLLPIHHSYAMQAAFIVPIATGAETVFGKRMVVANILKDLKEAKVTVFLGVPMLFNKLLAGILRGIRAKGAAVNGIMTALMGFSGLLKKAFGVNPGKKLFGAVLKQASLSTIRVCISGGGPLAPSIFRKYNQLGIDFIQGYGLTETSPIINLNPVEHYKETSVGMVIPGIDERILDPDERGVGEVIVKGSVVMKGYFEMPEETKAVFTEDGYFKTGDLGYLDSENYLYLTGRAKNMIVTEGGKNVYPEEIENEFQLFEEIDQIMIRGTVDEKNPKAEKIEALVFPNPDFFKEKITAARDEVKRRISEIVSEVNQRLQPYQRIEKTEILDERLEETTTKKIKRNVGEK
jgi:long-chain acyl-CoA synthetase